jgi:DNA-binding response OmpR family regulator
MSIAFAEFETTTQSELYVPRSSSTHTALLHCLIVSENAERREFLTESARKAGWEVAVYDEANAAQVSANRNRYALSIVDLDGLEAGSASNFRTLAEQFSAASQPLVMICGSEENALEEIWARQLGVWLYLAGVDPTCDVASLCAEARQVVQKQSEPTYARTA